MAKQNSTDLKAIQEEILNSPRREIGSTELLQARILEQTKDMVQAQAVEDIATATKLPQRVLPNAWIPMALAASLVLAVFIWLPQSTNMTTLPSPEVVEQFSSAELEFQDTLLLQDELLFADL